MTENEDNAKKTEEVVIAISNNIRKHLADGLQKELTPLARGHHHFDEKLLNAIVKYVRGNQ